MAIWVLGVWIDLRLCWGPHVKNTLSKLETRTNALFRLTASTWGATFARVRQIYSAVIKPSLAYGSAVWLLPTDEKEQTRRRSQPKGPAREMRKIQNRCLRAITGAYRATPIPVLEVEAFIPPLDLALDAKLAQFRLRHRQSGMERVVSATCEQIRRKLWA